MAHKKWDKLLEEVKGSSKRKILASLLENEAANYSKLLRTKVGPFQKFVLPLIRRAYPTLVGGESPRPKDAPLKKLTEQVFAEHHPDDPDWEEWKQSVKDRVSDIVNKNTTRGLHEEAEELPPDLKAELDNLHMFEPPDPPTTMAGGLVSVQPMTSPVGGLAFYRPRFAWPRGSVGSSGRKTPNG